MDDGFRHRATAVFVLGLGVGRRGGGDAHQQGWDKDTHVICLSGWSFRERDHEGRHDRQREVGANK
jgi:hypothetical protein